MLPFGVTIPATVPQRSEIPEVLMNYPVLSVSFSGDKRSGLRTCFAFEDGTDRLSLNVGN